MSDVRDGLKNLYNDLYGSDGNTSYTDRVEDKVGVEVSETKTDTPEQIKAKAQAIEAARETKEPEKSGMEELEELVGLTTIKHDVKELVALAKVRKIREEKGMKPVPVSLHLVFSGNPGTGKTTVARILAKLYKEIGILETGQLVETDRSGLVAGYVGQTAIKTREKINEAMGGVLFIDEAYSLADDRGGSYGDEAINTIVQEMENRREDLVVIFAGYPNEMETFLNKNPGLRSRIAFHVPFADYSSEELCGIARIIGKSKGVKLSEAAIAKLSAAFDSARIQPDFGNGRYVRNVIELSKMNQASRILSMDPDDMTEEALTSIEDVDIEIPAINRETKRTVGFAS
ncbi:MAG: AAA family ATPase [Clostridia bacterium]|nr:AAA family ATPase [Clostridia bacterium]